MRERAQEFLDAQQEFQEFQLLTFTYSNEIKDEWTKQWVQIGSATPHLTPEEQRKRVSAVLLGEADPVRAPENECLFEIIREAAV